MSLVLQTEGGRIDIANVLHRVGDLAAALFQQRQAQVVGGNPGVERMLGRNALGRLDVAVGDQHLVVFRASMTFSKRKGRYPTWAIFPR